MFKMFCVANFVIIFLLLPHQKSATQISTQKSLLTDPSVATPYLAEQSNPTRKPKRDKTTNPRKDVDLSSQFLPDNLPEGDPVHYAYPIFLEEPGDNFVVKSKPAELQCKVAHALSVHFQCNDEVQNHAVTENHVDPETGIRYTEARVQITRDQVEEFFGDYHCACVAVSGQGALKSRLAYVTIAFLKKEFEVPPYSDQSLEGKQVELRCHPPKGKPEPNIYWLKNERKIDESDQSFIVTQEGHLIIVSARLEDSANYTCVAENIAATRKSTPAEINIYVSGGWSSWSSWSTCSVSCGKGFKRRSRVCDNPLPLNGERPCPGQATQKKSCEFNCPGENGDWSTWSSWSTCSPECRQMRRRKCDNPPPTNGGHYCFGVDYDTNDCSGGLCRRTVWVEPSIAEESTDSAPVASSEIALYIGLSLAVVVFLVVILVALSLLRRRRLPSGYTLTQSAYEAQHHKKVLGYSPDITSGGNTELTSVCYEYSYPDSNSNTSKASYGKSVSEHHYEQPMVILPSRSPVDSIVKPLISDTSSSSTGGNISPRSAGTFDRSPGILQSSTPIPRNTSMLTETLFTKWASVTSSGARITLPESNISLTVPEGAIGPGQTQDVFISVIHDTKSFPDLQPGQTLLSPVIICGPHQASKKLKKPVILSFPHSASLRQGNWTISVAQATDGDNLSWRNVVTLGQETINSPVYTQLDLNTCHIVADSLSSFALLGHSAPNPPAFKSLRIAAFAQEFPQGSDLTVRLYCVQDTDHAVKFVTETEKQFGGRLLDKPVSSLLQYGGQNLRLKLERLGEGWTVQAGAELQEVPFSHLWSNNNPSLHCSFTLRHAVPHIRSLNMQVQICQEGNTNKCLLKINTNISASTGSGHREYKLRPSSSGCSSNDSYSCGTVFRLPTQTKETLSRMLDAPVSIGNDWRMLAERLNVHRYTAFFATRPSPTEAILNLWEARNRESNATQGLLNILRGMGRFDAAHLLEHDLQLT